MYKPLPDGITIQESKVQGLGLFATQDFQRDVGILARVGCLDYRDNVTWQQFAIDILCSS